MNELFIYGDIGNDNKAIDVESKLAVFDGGPVKVRINSRGGDVYEGVAILNALRGYPGELTVVVEALAASAASFIAVGAGASRVIIRPNAELMIHKAWTMLAGNSDDIDKTKADLARQDVKLAKIYAERAGGELDDWLDVMAAETWYSADEALAAGLVDAIEDAKVATPVAAAMGGSEMFAQFRYSSRSAAPPPTFGSRSESAPSNSTPSDGQKGDTVSIQNLAQELGVEPDVLRKKLSGFFNETVTVSGEVEVTYPAETPVAPTERVTVEPTIGDTLAEDGETTDAPDEAIATAQNAAVDAAGLGLTFVVGTIPDGWDITVDETTGVVTAKAPTNVEVGDIAEASVQVNGSTDIPVTFKVRSLSDDGEDTTDGAGADTSAEEGAAGAALNDVITVPRSVWNEYMADRAKYAAQLEADKQRELEAKIDGHIRAGRYSAAHRSQALSAYQADPVIAEKVWGALPANKAVPVAELGHSGDTDAQMSRVEALRAKAKANRENKNKETKNV